MFNQILKATLFLLLILPTCLWANEAQIVSFKGEVSIISPKGDIHSPVKGEMIAAQYEIQTEFNSYCDIALNEANSFRIKENTLIQISNLGEESQKSDGSVVKKIEINLFEGTVVATLNDLPKDTQFNVTTPVATAGATGTAFQVIYTEQNQNTNISVYDKSVRAQSRGEADKFTHVDAMRKVDVAPWSLTMIRAEGRGVLSEVILGKSFVRSAETTFEIEMQGTSTTKEGALLAAQQQLTLVLLNLHVDQETTVDQFLLNDIALTEKVFDAISDARVLGHIDNPDQTTTAKIQFNSQILVDILNRPLYGVPQNIKTLSMMEYSKKFGAKARVTTERAAKVEGYRNLAETIFGTVINSHTTVQDFAVENDTVRTTIQGVVRGARVVRKQYFSDGSIFALMEIKADLIPAGLAPIVGDVFGQNYLSRPQIIDYQAFDEYRRSS